MWKDGLIIKKHLQHHIPSAFVQPTFFLPWWMFLLSIHSFILLLLHSRVFLWYRFRMLSSVSQATQKVISRAKFRIWWYAALKTAFFFLNLTNKKICFVRNYLKLTPTIPEMNSRWINQLINAMKIHNFINLCILINYCSKCHYPYKFYNSEYN